MVRIKFATSVFIFVLASTAAFAASQPSGAEASFIKKFPKIFKRTGKTLFVNLQNGKSLEFTNKESDEEKEDEQTLIVSLSGYINRTGVAVLKKDFYEGGEYSILSLATGSEYVVPSAPLWSPTQEYFIAVNFDEAGYTDNEVNIGSCDKNQCIELLSKAGNTANAKWLGHKKVQYDVINFEPGTGKTSVAETVTCEIKAELKCSSAKPKK